MSGITRSSEPIAQTNIAKQSTGVSVLTASTVVASNNTSRAQIMLVNDGANVIYVQLATATDGPGATLGEPTAPTAVSGQGIRLNANGGSWGSTSYTGPIAAIAPAGATNLCVSEV